MNEIKCPHCGKTFTIDETQYENIVKQVRDHQFEEEIKKRDELYNSKLEIKIKEELDKQKESFEEQIKIKEKANLELESKLKTKETENELEVTKALNEKEKELTKTINELQNKISGFENEKALAIQNSINEFKDKINEKNAKIQELSNTIALDSKESELKVQSIKTDYDNKLKVKDEQIDYYKDLKTRMSTKMLGETLEQHCSNSYNMTLRPIWPNSYFEKDNDAKTGSKGDFIFRDTEDGIEYISIMFEMKNEADLTSTKHKNEDFFKELDKDRNEKSCEYAILVTTLESDSELYNQGIVDVSYKYPKMFVIRPQFFIPIITLLVNAAKNSIQYKKQLLIEKNQNIDISHFEDNINTFKEGFSRNYKLASDSFSKAIEEIDKSIDHLNKIKEDLTKADNNLRLANNKADDLSIKKLTKNSPTVALMFDELKK